MAPKADGLQCWNKIHKDHKYHCSEHGPKAKALYLTYKKLCTIADNIKIEDYKKYTNAKEQIAHLQRCYYILQRAYNGRIDHRTFSFIPRLFDHGHNFQLEKLLKKTSLTESCLQEIYCKLIQKPKEQKIQKEEPITEETQEIIEVIVKVETFKKQRHNDEKEMERLFEIFIKNNEIELIEQHEIVTKLSLKLYELGPTKEIELFIYLNVILTLRKWNYFSSITNTLSFVKIETIPRNFVTFTKYIQDNYQTKEILDFILLIDMYKSKILPIVSEYVYVSTVWPVLSYEGNKWKLTNQIQKEPQYLSMAEYKQQGITRKTIDQIPNIMKNLTKAQSHKMKKMLQSDSFMKNALAKILPQHEMTTIKKLIFA